LNFASGLARSLDQAVGGVKPMLNVLLFAPMKHVLAAVLAMLGVVFVPADALAHHGTNISYDRTKPVTFTGTVTEFRLANPHPQLYVDVKDDSGKVTNWGCEVAANPYQLMLSGWTRQRSATALKPGTTVTVTVAPSRAGTPVGVVLKIVNAQGEELLATADAN
jgi:Family of unknown function (DUF6152)